MHQNWFCSASGSCSRNIVSVQKEKRKCNLIINIPCFVRGDFGFGEFYLAFKI